MAADRRELAVSAFDQSPAMVFGLTGDGLRYTVWNEVGRAFVDHWVELGMAMEEVPLLRGLQMGDQLREVMRTGEPYRAGEWRMHVPDPDGTLRERFLDMTFGPWRDERGGVFGVLALIRDVTDAVRARQAVAAEAADWKHRFQDARAAMASLQASLLPAEVPVLPGLQIGARYLLAESDTAAGGDWFDVIPLPDGRVALAVGDVVGHGIAASAVMGQLRSVLGSHLAAGSDVPAALGALEAYAARVPGAAATTVCVAVLDRETGVLEYCTAGHPPPLLVAESGWRYLETTGAGPLCSGRGFATATAEVGAGELLLLYTDGLVERPGRAPAASTVEIGQLVTAALGGLPALPGPAHAADRVCEQGIELLTRLTGYADDITVLAAYRVAAPVPLTLGVSAGPSAVETVLREVDRWLTVVDAGPGDHMALRHAVAELVANTVEHAYRDREPGAVAVLLDLEPDGYVRLTVSDEGEWRRPEADGAANGRMRGLGLAMTAQLVDEFTTDHADYGTSATVRRRLRRPAPLLSRPEGSTHPAEGVPSAEAQLRIAADPDDPSRLTVAGALRLDTADRLEAWLEREARGGTRSLTLDLSGLTLLASAGVQLLLRARAAAAGHDESLTLVAAPGSVAQQVLDLVAVDHLAAAR